MSNPRSARIASSAHGRCRACAEGRRRARTLETSSQFGEKANRTRATSSGPKTNSTI